MSQIFATFNMKGGVAKTTTVYNLAIALTKFHSWRVLLVDIDPQGNSSVALGIEIWELDHQIKDVLQGKIKASNAIIKTESGVSVLPSNILLAEEEIPIAGLPGRELLLRKALAPISSEYDIILIDCPPNIGVFSINALMASNGIIVPVDMSYLGLLGISAIERALELVRDRLDHPLEITGVLATRYDGRNKLSKTVVEKLQEHFGEKMFETCIPEAVKIREAPSYSQSIFDYDPKGIGAKAYSDFTNEVIARLQSNNSKKKTKVAK
jgi:chromosome partitioning protein